MSAQPTPEPRRRVSGRQRPEAPPPALSGAGAFQLAMFDETYAKFKAAPGPCALCRQVTRKFTVSLYKPPDAQEIGAAEGKNRAVLYYLCLRCTAEGGHLDIEESLFERYQRQRHKRPWNGSATAEGGA